MFIQSFQSKIPELPLERVFSLSIFKSNEKVDEKYSEALAMFEVQPPCNRSKPQRWEDLRPSQSPEEKQEVKKGT